MECKNCELRQRQYYCANCLRNQYAKCLSSIAFTHPFVEQQPYHKTLRDSCFPSDLANDRPCSPLTDHHDPYSQRLVQSCQRLSCRTALNVQQCGITRAA
ncbi:hypothetical protein P692DRAFT_20347714 [Suillus brevipes Sb2]|nr:hypothetical protein P692DRAFT_20347714 [Suillus brevipes Sb2]